MKILCLILIVTGILIVPTNLIAMSKFEYNVFLTADADGGIPKDSPAESFDCHRKVYVVIEGMGLKKGKHILEGFWLELLPLLMEQNIFQGSGQLRFISMDAF